MALSRVNCSTPFGSELHIEAVQSVVPTNPTDPRESFKLHVSQDLSSSAILQRRFHVLLCYNKAREEDSGWHAAGWIKESLGRALQEQPLLAGRLRQCEESGINFQIVSNDSGVRLVEATADMRLADFLPMKAKGSEAEAQLVFWEDVLEQNPQFSPLFYVQVTNFTCGGYSIGISCSLLLVDPFALTGFLKRWADLHSSMVNLPKVPTFYLPNLAKPGASPALRLMGSNTGKEAAKTVTFWIPTKILNLEDDIHNKNLAAFCIDEAERECGTEMGSKLSLLVKVPSENAGKVEICSRQGLLEGPLLDCTSGVSSCARTSWDELGLESVCFNKGKKPAYATCWINSVIGHGSVMIVPSTHVSTSGIQIVVTFT